jgi:glucose-6-phosphate 1-dehydrogenase
MVSSVLTETRATVKVLGAGETLTVVIFGATGDLAKRKLFPALYQLMYACPDAPLLPIATRIVGYGRNAMQIDDFIAKACAQIKGAHRADFLKQISYFQGKYDVEGDFAKLHEALLEVEDHSSKANRLFFLSVPPTVFASVCQNIHLQARAVGGFTRLIIEKPFGRDSRTFEELNAITSGLFREDQIYRIDHYLAKEKVLNLLVFRFANQIYEPLWDRHHIAQVDIVFKENIGTEGRGGYFDGFGIIRDIMQNHLLQVLLWLAMEPPERLDAEHIATEKCRILRDIRTLGLEDCFLGQFGAGCRAENGVSHAEPGYLEDSTVPEGSKCPTFAAVVLNIDNERWRGVPFLMRAGKGLNERLAEVVITFKRQSYNSLVPSEPNQLVLRIQPDEGIFIKCINKRPGWKQTNTAPVQLDMSYDRVFPGSYVAGAYERMLLNASAGEQSLFVGSEELVEAWRIFTPLLDEIDAKAPQPVCYPFGARAPEGFGKFVTARGVVCDEATEYYYLPKFIRGIPVLVQEAPGIWRADNSKLGSHNGGLCFRKTPDMSDRAQEDFLLKYGTTTKGIDVGNDWVKCPAQAPAPREFAPRQRPERSPSGRRQEVSQATPLKEPAARDSPVSGEKAARRRGSAMETANGYLPVPNLSEEAKAELLTTPPRGGA